MNKPILVLSWGEVFRMTPEQFGRYIEAGVRGQAPDPRNFGVSVGLVAFNATDADRETFEMANGGAA